MTDNDVIAILNELWRYEHTEKYTDDQIRFACEYAINKIRSYGDLQQRYIKTVIDYGEYIEKSKHHSPIRDNY